MCPLGWLGLQNGMLSASTGIRFAIVAHLWGIYLPDKGRNSNHPSWPPVAGLQNFNLPNGKILIPREMALEVREFKE